MGIGGIANAIAVTGKAPYGDVQVDHLPDKSGLRSFAPLDLARHDYNRGVSVFLPHCFAIACFSHNPRGYASGSLATEEAEEL